MRYPQNKRREKQWRNEQLGSGLSSWQPQQCMPLPLIKRPSGISMRGGKFIFRWLWSKSGRYSRDGCAVWFMHQNHEPDLPGSHHRELSGTDSNPWDKRVQSLWIYFRWLASTRHPSGSGHPYLPWDICDHAFHFFSSWGNDPAHHWRKNPAATQTGIVP